VQHDGSRPVLQTNEVAGGCQEEGTLCTTHLLTLTHSHTHSHTHTHTHKHTFLSIHSRTHSHHLASRVVWKVYYSPFYLYLHCSPLPHSLLTIYSMQHRHSKINLKKKKIPNALLNLKNSLNILRRSFPGPPRLRWTRARPTTWCGKQKHDRIK
jgi:ABC-type Zn2+ transport system substrate-binding protein/surface adhesin